jgi:hypothetical protein
MIRYFLSFLVIFKRNKYIYNNIYFDIIANIYIYLLYILYHGIIKWHKWKKKIDKKSTKSRTSLLYMIRSSI